MKSKIKIFITLLLSIVLMYSITVTDETGVVVKTVRADKTQTTDILFIGNSMTYYNTLCNVVQGIARQKGHNVKCSAATNGGRNLIYNATADKVINGVKHYSQWTKIKKVKMK